MLLLFPCINEEVRHEEFKNLLKSHTQSLSPNAGSLVESVSKSWKIICLLDYYRLVLKISTGFVKVLISFRKLCVT